MLSLFESARVRYVGLAALFLLFIHTCAHMRYYFMLIKTLEYARAHTHTLTLLFFIGKLYIFKLIEIFLCLTDRAIFLQRWFLCVYLYMYMLYVYSKFPCFKKNMSTKNYLSLGYLWKIPVFISYLFCWILNRLRKIYFAFE